MNIKHLLLLFTIALASFSCSKDKDENSPSIVGKWEFVTDTYQYYDAKGVELVEEREVKNYDGWVKKPYFDIRSNGTMTLVDFDADGKSADPIEFTYTIKGDKIIMTRDTKEVGKVVIEAPFTIKNDVLTIVVVEEEFEDGGKEVMTSVSKRIK
ncbi:MULTISPECIES: lipocalin family protein [Sphingobacterium]|uniref:lipocalin family protein n=1 Tax=Sphingobacterium TaxID=28453 RepID=UPI0013DC377A|nr:MULTISPECIES: lipocalin family protein [unclassified Sphingobacterium]